MKGRSTLRPYRGVEGRSALRPYSMSASETAAQLFSTGVAALRAGDRVYARALLIQAVRADPSRARAWLWLAAALDETTHRRECLERALTLDPSLEAAKRALEELRNADAGNADQAPLTPHASALSPQPSALTPQPSALTPQPSALTPQSSPLSPHPSPLTPHPSPLSPPYLNPWRWIWSRPAAALRSAIFTRNLIETSILGGLAGINLIFVWAAIRRIGAEIRPVEIGAVALILGGPLGASILLAGGLLLAGAGRRLGGKGNSGAVRAALAWAGIPLIVGLLLWLIQLILLPASSFGGPGATIIGNLIAWICAAIHLFLIAWSGTLSVVGLAEAHRFGYGRAAATWFLAGVLVFGGCLSVLVGAALLIMLRGG